MSLWQKLIRLRNALNAGEQLANSTTWKSVGVATSAIAALLAAVLPFIEQFETVDQQTLEYIAHGVWGVTALINLYIHPATTKTIGLKPK